MDKKANICISCTRKCSLRSDRILYCDSFKAQDGVRTIRKRMTGRPHLDQFNLPDSGDSSLSR